MSIEKKVKGCKDCDDGKHTFIPAIWKISPSSHTCTLFVCQHCLVSADKAEWETMSALQEDKLKKAKAKAKA